MAKYMIHTYTKRLWYVKEYLLPSMYEQGIKEEDIIVWNDYSGKGNLISCIESFMSVPNDDDGIWHLQDDIIICRDFKKRTEELDTGIVCGFCCEYDPDVNSAGVVRIINMWWSFPCIRIPNKYAREFAEWFEARKDNDFEIIHLAKKNKNDDLLFRYWLERNYITERAICVKPNLVDHIDYLIGGTSINHHRGDKIIKSPCFEDIDLVYALKEKLEERNDIH